MAHKIFDTYHAPEDEIEGVKQALDTAKIPWYETDKGRWWVGSAALWVADEKYFALARQVIDQFQQSWRQTATTRQHNTQKNWTQILFAFIAILIVLYIISFPFRL